MRFSFDFQVKPPASIGVNVIAVKLAVKLMKLGTLRG